MATLPGPRLPRHPPETVPRRPAEVTPPLAVVGCDFRVATSRWRDRLTLDATERLALGAALQASCGADGLVVLETCNRVEWILTAPSPRWAAEVARAQMVERWLHPQFQQEHLQLQGVASDRRTLPVPYLYTGRTAVLHLLRVAVGLESFVVGEREIAGQLNRALAHARDQGTASPVQNALQTALGRTVRKVQRLTRWRQAARGVHGLAVETLRTALAKGSEMTAVAERRTTVVVAGMGEIGRKVAGLAAATGQHHVLRVNRTPAVGVKAWDTLGPLCAEADALIVATGAPAPIVDLRGLTRPGRADLVVIDLGAPQQVLVDAADPVRLLGLDALLALPASQPDPEDMGAVHELVEEGVREFLVECQKRDLAGVLRAAHDAYDRLSYQAVPALLATELGDIDPDRRRRLEATVRDLLRIETRSIVDHIEAAATARAGRGV